jgi:GDPmannose 4,6-dehydratase
MPKLQLGNLDAKRDWGHARDYVRAMWMMLQQDKPDDFVVATGEAHSVREFCECAFECVGCKYNDWVEVNSDFIRPVEVPHLQGIADHARDVLGWEPQVTFRELVQDMVRADLALIAQE